LVADIFGNPLGESKDERYDVLGHNRSVDFTRIGEDDVAVNEFGIQEWMNGSRGTMHPAQLVRELQLFRADRKSKDDFGARQFLFQVVVTGETDNFELRKLFPKSTGKPVRGNPQIEAMVGGDEQLHSSHLADDLAARYVQGIMTSVHCHAVQAIHL